jgi:hypothetical protein
MICELVRRGKKVGITANSHKVIRNLIDATIKAADEPGIALQCCQKADEVEDPQHRLTFAKSNEDLFAVLSGGAASVGGGTAWLWSRPTAPALHWFGALASARRLRGRRSSTRRPGRARGRLRPQ